MRHALIPLIAVALAACGGSDAVSDGANNTAGLTEVIAEANQAAEAVHEQANEDAASTDGNASSPSRPVPESEAIIPAQYRGRWGMVPNDCTSTRGDAKGLIAIGERMVRFFESTATLREQRPAIATSFSGLFAFEGEGERWQTVMTFTRTGDALLRAEKDGSFTYRRCA